MTYWEIVNKVSGDIGLSPDTVDKTYRAFWKYIRDSIQSLPLKEDISEEEFLMLRPNFNIPSLGKLTCTYKRYFGVKEKFKHIKKLRETYEGT
jgi:hypothetical protein